jgi:hypothetical protein
VGLLLLWSANSAGSLHLLVIKMTTTSGELTSTRRFGFRDDDERSGDGEMTQRAISKLYCHFITRYS